MSKFPCTGCGQCCKKVGLAVSNAFRMLADGVTDPYVMEIAAFPYQTNEKGHCENLLPDNSCAIYETRPDICNIEKTWAKHHKEGISLENYFLSTAMLCNKMMSEDGADENFFISSEFMNNDEARATNI